MAEAVVEIVKILAGLPTEKLVTLVALSALCVAGLALLSLLSAKKDK